MTRVLYILPYDWGGMPHYTAELANAVSKYLDVVVVGSDGINVEYFSDDITIIKLFDKLDFSINNLGKMVSLKSLSQLYSYRKLKEVANIDPDIIHLTTPLIPPLAFYLLFHKIDKNYPILFTKHGIISNSGLKIKVLEEGISGLSEKLVNFDKIVVHTQSDKNFLINNKGISSDSIAVIPHGVYSFFKIYNQDASIVPIERNLLLFFGNIREYKGLKYLIEAVPLISKEIPDVKIIIAGMGDLSPYYNLIKPEDKSRFIIYNEFIPDKFVSELFQQAEIVILPYTKMSGQSGILNIACAFEKPVVASNVGGFDEVVENGVTGFLVPPKDSKALAHSVITILKDNRLKEKMSNNIRKKSHERSWDLIAKKHINLYNEMMINRR